MEVTFLGVLIVNTSLSSKHNLHRGDARRESKSIINREKKRETRILNLQLTNSFKSHKNALIHRDQRNQKAKGPVQEE